MTLARLSLLLAFLALATWAMAGENLPSSQTTASNADVGSQSSANRRSGVETLPSNPEVVRRQDHGVSLAPRGGVCYVMRSYKVKPTERVRDYENFSRGYSECEMASSFQIRSAEAHQKKPEAPQSPATLQ